MTEIKDKIRNDEKFIDNETFDNDIDKLIDAYPDGVPDRIIAKALHIDILEVEKLIKKAILKLKRCFLSKNR